ncbi:MAG: tetratricopeptide repeat protein [Bacteroidales bacterium]|nr:tetratricopeptide repeat protein [Bacteroidales bacterium]MCK9499008.1 tetratricopeptide repeat protein [Bacteroidales bacterium]NLB85854.1 tetratricopeptide repeat protein [Bacteroidales bacterium]
MKIKYSFILIILVTVLISCSSKINRDIESKDLAKEISEKEKEIYNSDSLNIALANELIDMYLTYATDNPDENLSPEYLFKAAEISMNINKAKNAVDYLSKIENNYKNYEKYVSSLFLKAFILENYLKDYENAKKYYSIIVENYPDHALAQDSEAALSFLGIDDMELIKIFEQAM